VRLEKRVPPERERSSLGHSRETPNNCRTLHFPWGGGRWGGASTTPGDITGDVVKKTKKRSGRKKKKKTPLSNCNVGLTVPSRKVPRGL